ncbi:MAG: OmpA family protein [Betaproteobacteria bacterium]|nr:OmpA family protein [Betaproteobacteria bacterium]
MHSARCLAVTVLSLFAAAAFAADKDAANCQDHPLLSRIPDYWIQSCTQKQFDSYAFASGKGKTTQVEGQFTNLRYQPPASLTTKPSTLQLLRNVENAIKQVGGMLVASDSSKETLTLSKDGKELWIEVWADYTGKYILTIVEKAAMAQDLVANAAALGEGLKATGHITMEGIYFETGKSELKAESAAATGELAKLLKGDAGLKVYVVGHTDNAGNLESNMKLSQDRAQSVVQALVKTHGIDAARLRAYGNGPYAPVASNDGEAGRAKNRRVELVKQ